MSCLDRPSCSIPRTVPGLPGLRIEEKLGEGASGVVFLCLNNVLNRKEALKVWLHLRPWDRRNKASQGRLEAIKATSVGRGPTPTIYTAGLRNGFFFATIEVIAGVSLQQHLGAEKLTLLDKRSLAREFVSLMGSFPRQAWRSTYGQYNGKPNRRSYSFGFRNFSSKKLKVTCGATPISSRIICAPPGQCAVLLYT